MGEDEEDEEPAGLDGADCEGCEASAGSIEEDGSPSDTTSVPQAYTERVHGEPNRYAGCSLTGTSCGMAASS